MTFDDFERAVFDQKPIAAEHYDRAYFFDNWGEGVNNYSVEARRPIEGRTPELIEEVFAPKKVLDFGCGPGAMMYLLWERGIDVSGLYFCPLARDAAPEVIRDRIHLLDAAGPIELGRDYDLVISREMLEHLTVLQIQQAVQSLCRLSSRFIYLTTRFSQRGQFLALDTELEVDLTHITLLNKDFLRCLFVLQGFRSRPDLEARMDWKGYGRVIVVEKASGGRRVPLA